MTASANPLVELALASLAVPGVGDPVEILDRRFVSAFREPFDPGPVFAGGMLSGRRTLVADLADLDGDVGTAARQIVGAIDHHLPETPPSSPGE